MCVNAQGSESEGGDKEDFAEYDRDFIDDTEVHEYFGGDWHKPKHSGFYINQVQMHCLTQLLVLLLLTVGLKLLVTQDCKRYCFA